MLFDHHNRHVFMEAAGGDSGGAGGGDAGGNPGGTDNNTGNNDGGTGGAGDKGGDKGGTPDFQTELAALKAEVEKLTAEKKAAAEKAEAERKANLSEAEKLAEERKAFQAEVDSTKATLKAEARNQALQKLGVQPKFAKYAPDVDPRTTEGAAELESWAKENPELLKQTPGAPAPYQPPPKSAVAEILSGNKKHPFMSAAGLRKLLN